jgi:hypothetical protein
MLLARSANAAREPRRKEAAFFPATHPSRLACVRLQGGLTCLRATGAGPWKCAGVLLGLWKGNSLETFPVERLDAAWQRTLHRDHPSTPPQSPLPLRKLRVRGSSEFA